MQKIIKVVLRDNPYSITIASSFDQLAIELLELVSSDQVMIISNETIAPLYLPRIKEHLSPFHCDTFILPDGEQYKTLDSYQLITDELVMRQHRRNTTLIALGGGVVGDITGFVAATYHRGVNYLQIPTTLLAQVDAAIGGKTAINHLSAKNSLGTFYQPKGVLIDVSTLSSLHDRDYRSGIAEIIKYGLIKDADFFQWLEDNVQSLLARDQDTLIRAITRSCEIKANIVSQDEKETSGLRALLNYGHTLAHAIETVSDYQRYLHGEAVAIGMVFAAKLSEKLGYLNNKHVNRIQGLIAEFGLPIDYDKTIKQEDLIACMLRDKKNINKELSFIVLTDIGAAKVEVSVDAGMVRELG